MELRDYIRMLRRNWISVIALGLVGLLAGGTFSVLSKPVYTAETQLFVATQNSGSVQDLQTGNMFVQARVSSYVATAKTPTVLQPVIDSLGLEISPKQLAKSIKTTSDVKTVLITISVDDRSPVQAAAVAHAIASSLITTVDNLEKPTDGGSSPVKLSVVTPATAPSAPSSPNLPVNIVLGLFLGLALGIVAALLRTSLDTRIRGEADLIRITDVPVLGGIAFDHDAIQNPLLSEENSHSHRSESFRHLRTNLQFAQVNISSNTLLVTSSLPGEGKSTTATNLALAMAEAGKSVVLVDADLRRPMVAKYLGLEGAAGLTTALVGEAHLNDLLQPWGEHKLQVLTSGQVPPNPSELLGSENMSSLIQSLESDFDAVVIDAPPLLPVTDAAVLAQRVGGVIMVVGCHTVKSTEVEKALNTLKLVDADVLGIVLNRVPIKGPDAYAYSYYGYSSRSESETGPLVISENRIRTADSVELHDEDEFDRILRGPISRASRRG
ncbi:polysaccharide biosynthesis tyrosine autokinase [Arthrobacter psychrochitiniphilus]|uniref:non-specific protein-tyrosine kinase n=1 Tax=Arthrobacter psychrochitiniphilus TaxID=291045 RepID=A0A2V3DYM2_9MICC|nr:polysaccharide biosynthesis tyrosine autokinase [Arthrobacter psychrochitiniphilus]NYG16584.1 capsular exopolysaccharide synthesis family protein [Arthrobacter psychrochitiniphilus]PXA69630.1 chromosome partitioning protein [Arthrobacter psychrochitiniphilus]